MSELDSHQRAFLDLLIAREALKFGDFVLKSGRHSPYFINTGCFDKGSDLTRLGQAYANRIQHHFGDSIDIIFGPAYKGIPLALATATAYEALIGRPVGWTYDRKEIKDHGDKGAFVGAPLANDAKVVVVDDVMTAGTALRETMDKLTPLACQVQGCIISVDRMEAGPGGTRASKEVAEQFKLPVHAILDMSAVVDYLHGSADAAVKLTDEQAQAIRERLLS